MNSNIMLIMRATFRVFTWVMIAVGFVIADLMRGTLVVKRKWGRGEGGGRTFISGGVSGYFQSKLYNGTVSGHPV